MNRSVGISFENRSIFDENQEPTHTFSVALNLPEKLWEVIKLLNRLPQEIQQVEDCSDLIECYNHHKAEREENFSVPCYQITSREGDQHHPTRCGYRIYPNPLLCPVCEIKLRNFHITLTSNSEEEKIGAQRDTNFIYRYCKGQFPIFGIALVVSALRDYRTIQQLPNARIKVWENDDEHYSLPDITEPLQYWRL